MLQVQRSIEIEAPIEQAWETLSNITGIQDWSETVSESHFHTELQRGVGAGRTNEVPGAGAMVEDVTEWVENERISYAVSGMPGFVKALNNTWQLDPAEGTTRATAIIQIETGLGPIGTLLERFALKPNFIKVLEQQLQELKDHLEASRA